MGLCGHTLLKELQWVYMVASSAINAASSSAGVKEQAGAADV